jgi:hypothetical protein
MQHWRRSEDCNYCEGWWTYVTSSDLIQAMVESFRIYGKAESNMSDCKEDKVIATIIACTFNCNLCEKGGHKAMD